MQERRIIEIDEEKCNGCGLCVNACHEGAIQMVDGKAKLVSDIYCDGLGDCLGPCPTGAISIISRPAEAYDEKAVEERKQEMNKPASALAPASLPCGCPGSMARALKPAATASRPGPTFTHFVGKQETAQSELLNWPVQLKLVPPGAPYLKGADILLAADCAPVAVPNFHARYLKDKPVVIACPKLDDNSQQIDKLAEILMTARPASLTVVRMEVPCCGGIVRVAQEAIWRSGLAIPLRVIVVGADGQEQSNTLSKTKAQDTVGGCQQS